MRKWLLPILFLTIVVLSGCTTKNHLAFTSTIEATQVDVNSEVSGKVGRINVEEGSDVKVGDVLVTLDSTSAQLQVNQAEASLTAAKAKLDELKSGSREEQVRQAQAAMESAKAKLDELKSGSRSEQISQAEAAVAQAQNGVKTASDNYDYRMKNLENAHKLLEVGGASQQQVDDLQNLVDSAFQQLRSAKEQLNSAQSQLDLLKNGATPEAVRAAEAAYNQAKAQYDLVKSGATSQTITVAQTAVDQAQKSLDLAKLQLDKYTIKTPISGRMIYSNVDPGEVVFPGSDISTISDIKDLWLKFYIPETQKHLVEVGKIVTISSKAYPKDNIQGKITFVSDKAEFTPKNTETKEAKESTVFEVKVKILNMVDKLRPGMTVDVQL